jgi:hypothetical protein
MLTRSPRYDPEFWHPREGKANAGLLHHYPYMKPITETEQMIILVHPIRSNDGPRCPSRKFTYRVGYGSLPQETRSEGALPSQGPWIAESMKPTSTNGEHCARPICLKCLGVNSGGWWLVEWLFRDFRGCCGPARKDCCTCETKLPRSQVATSFTWLLASLNTSINTVLARPRKPFLFATFSLVVWSSVRHCTLLMPAGLTQEREIV